MVAALLELAHKEWQARGANPAFEACALCAHEAGWHKAARAAVREPITGAQAPQGQQGQQQWWQEAQAHLQGPGLAQGTDVRSRL